MHVSSIDSSVGFSVMNRNGINWKEKQNKIIFTRNCSDNSVKEKKKMLNANTNTNNETEGFEIAKWKNKKSDGISSSFPLRHQIHVRSQIECYAIVEHVLEQLHNDMEIFRFDCCTLTIDVIFLTQRFVIFS